MDKTKHMRLQELDRSDFEIVKDEPDIRGWDVRNIYGEKIGFVEELILDTQEKKVRYMVVDLDDNEMNLSRRRVLLPIGIAELHQKDDDVIVPNITFDHLKALPDYDRKNLTPETERLICTTLGRKTEKSSLLEGKELHPEFYRHEYYNDDNLYKHRLQEIKSGEQKKNESDYERGLKLWELRSEGGILPEKGEERTERRSEISEEARMAMVQNRRKTYEDHRRESLNSEHDHSHKKHNSIIISRSRDEGSRDDQQDRR
jgi:sporulation protein YlmC with PRC-barrel domain